MKHTLSKRFVLCIVLAVAAITVFVADQATQAQRPERNQRPGGMRGGGGRGMNPMSLIDSSWSDLTFVVKVEDDTLIKARSVYQKHRDDLEKTIQEARDSGDFQAIRGAMQEIGDGFKADLKAVLTAEQISQLDQLQQERMQRTGRQGGGRRGGGGRGGGGR